MTSLAALLLIGFLPGALLYRLPYGDRATRAALPAEERAFWAVVTSLVLTTFVALALAVPGRYSLDRVLVINGVVSALALAIGRTRLRYDTPAPRPGWSALGLALPVALGCWLFFPGSEYLLGGKDPGVYANEGVQIAQRGSIRIRDAALASVPDRFKDLFVSPAPGGDEAGTHEGNRFMGFFVTDRATGGVIGQFPHGLPVWMAIAYGLDGLTGVRNTAGAWALVGLAAVFLLWARLLGPLTASAGAVLLAINVAEVWFAPYPNSEVIQQALLAAALLGLARTYRDGVRALDVVAGAALGATLFLRFDAVLTLAAVGGGFVLVAAERGTLPRPGFLLALGAAAAAAVPYYAGPMRAYTYIPMVQIGGAVVLGLGAAAIAAAIVLAAVLHRRVPGWSGTWLPWLPRLGAPVVLALAVYAYFFREPAGLLAQHDAYAMRSLAWYTGPLALGLAVAGLVVVFLRDFWKDPVTLTAMTGLSAFFLYKIRIVPDHFWQARRYLAVILPMVAMLAAAFAWAPLRRLADRPRDGSPAQGRRRLALAAGVAIAAGVLAAVGWQSARATSAIRTHVEYGGVIPAIETLASRFTARDLLVVEARNASDAHVLATPLAYIYAKPVLLLTTTRPDPAVMADFLAWAWQAYDRVFFIADGGTALASNAVQARPDGLQRFEVPEYESLRNAYPTHVRMKKFSLSLFQLTPAPAGASTLDVDVGGQDDVWVLRIFAKQAEGAVSYRWTRDVSYVTMVNVPTASRRLTLWMSHGGRPAAAGDARVRVLLGTRAIGEITVKPGGFAPYTLDLPEGVVTAAAGKHGTLTWRLESTVWSPLKTLGVPDDRELGVMLDRVRIE